MAQLITQKRKDFFKLFLKKIGVWGSIVISIGLQMLGTENYGFLRIHHGLQRNLVSVLLQTLFTSYVISPSMCVRF